MDIEQHRDRGSDRNFRLQEDQRGGLKHLLRELGIKQEGLAETIGISQSWVSNLLSGTTPQRDRKAMEALVGEVRRTVERRNLQGLLTDEKAQGRYTFLDGILDQSGLNFRKPIAQPMGYMPVDAANYIPRPDEERALRYMLDRDARHYTFNLLVSGPPDSGKSTIIGYLQNMAGHDKVQVAQVHHNELIKEEERADPEREEKALLNLTAKTMAGAWDLPQPSTGEISHYVQLSHYLRESMAKVDPHKRRLLVIDNLEGLRSAALQRKFLAVVDDMFEKMGMMYPAKFAVVLGITPNSQALQDYLDYEKHGSRIEVSWFNQQQVRDLTSAVGGERLVRYSGQLYEQYGGQPFLTHLAATQLADDGRLGSEQVYQQALESPQPFNWHTRSIRKLLATEPDAQALFQLTCEAGSLDLYGLGVSPSLVEYLVKSGLVIEHKDGNTRTILPSSKFYGDLGLRL